MNLLCPFLGPEQMGFKSIYTCHFRPLFDANQIIQIMEGVVADPRPSEYKL